MQGLDVDQILALLGPNSIWDYVLYIIFFLGIVTLFMQPEGSMLTTILLALVLVGAFVDKVQAFPAHRCNFGTMLVRIMYFVVPLITAGVTKNPKSRMPAILMALLGLGYTFLLWFIEMNNPAVCRPLERDLTMVIDAVRSVLIV